MDGTADVKETRRPCLALLRTNCSPLSSLLSSLISHLSPPPLRCSPSSHPSCVTPQYSHCCAQLLPHRSTASAPDFDLLARRRPRTHFSSCNIVHSPSQERWRPQSCLKAMSNRPPTPWLLRPTRLTLSVSPGLRGSFQHANELQIRRRRCSSVSPHLPPHLELSELSLLPCERGQ